MSCGICQTEKDTSLRFILVRLWHPTCPLWIKFLTKLLLHFHFWLKFKPVRSTVLGRWKKWCWKEWKFWGGTVFVTRQISTNFARLLWKSIFSEPLDNAIDSTLWILYASLSLPPILNVLAGCLNKGYHVISHLIQIIRMWQTATLCIAVPNNIPCFL